MELRMDHGITPFIRFTVVEFAASGEPDDCTGFRCAYGAAPFPSISLAPYIDVQA